MSTFIMRHDLECTPERFWSLLFDLEFNEKLFEAMEFPEWKLLEVKETETSVLRRVKATPRMEMPAALVKLLGTSFGYEEVSTFDKANKVLKFVIKTNVMSDKLRNEGTVRCEPRGEGKSVRVVEIIAEAKVFGVGGMIEASFDKTFRSGWQNSAEFLNAWVKDHP